MTPGFFGSRWFASESRNTCREPVQHFVRWTSISTVTDSLIRLIASTGDRFISQPPRNDKGDLQGNLTRPRLSGTRGKARLPAPPRGGARASEALRTASAL